jgi:Phage tail lysozyme
MLAMERGESDFSPNAVGDSGKSVGSFQWDATRRAAIQRATGIDVSTAPHDDQLKAEDWESQHGDAGAQQFRKNLMQPGSIESYVRSGVGDFERSGSQGRDYNKRLPYARSAKEQFTKRPTVNVRNTPGNPINGANAAAAGSP